MHIIKKFKLDEAGKNILTVHCYDKVPQEQPKEMQGVLNHFMEVARKFVKDAYNNYKPL